MIGTTLKENHVLNFKNYKNVDAVKFINKKFILYF